MPYSDPEERRECDRKKSAKYRAQPGYPARKQAYDDSYYKGNRERILARQKEYYRAHREQELARAAGYRDGSRAKKRHGRVDHTGEGE